MAGVALFQPPKSSSGATFGTVGMVDVLPPVVLPPQPKSLVDAACIDGDLLCFILGAGTDGSAMAHASLEPQASAFENPENEL